LNASNAKIETAPWTQATATLSEQDKASVAAKVMESTVETGTSVVQSMRLFNAILGGKVSGAGTTTEVFRDVNDTKDRITATVDGAGNRLVIVKDLS
jgi:hypothetical protein